jgi:hypothetical protein
MSDGTGAAAAAGEGEGAAGAGGQGGAAGLLAGDGGAAGAGGTGGDGSGGAGGDGGQQDGGGAAWSDIFSDKAGGEGQTPLRDWVKAKGWKDPDAMAASARELEAKFLAGDKIVLPKDGDGPEVIEAFHKAIGRPENADGYEIKLPEGEELDEGLSKVVREAAFKAGVPAAMFAPMAEAFNAHIRELAQNAETAEQQLREQGVADYRTEVGDKFNVNIAAGNKAMKMLGIDGAAIAKIEQGLGTKETLALFAKLGHGMGEDILLDAGGHPRFSMSAEEAQAELDTLSKQPGYAEKLKTDPATAARRKHLIAVVAAHETRKREAAG